MTKFKVSFEVTIENDQIPDWIAQSVTEQLEGVEIAEKFEYVIVDQE